MQLSKTMSKAFILALGIALFLGGQAVAATFTVTKQNDDNGPCQVDDCTLREAILAANMSSGMDTVVLPAGNYQLSITGPHEDLSLSGDLNILENIEISGAAAGTTTIVGDGMESVFRFPSAPPAPIDNVIISDVTITRGAGGIFSVGADIMVVDSIVTGNSSPLRGGGIYAEQAGITLIGSTVSDNFSASGGGGIFKGSSFLRPADIILINSTVSGNRTDGDGGGILSIGTGDLISTNSTIVHNVVGDDPGDVGSAFFNVSGSNAFLTNTLIIGDCGDLYSPNITSNGGNIQSPGSDCNLTDPSDQVNVPEPGILPLGDYGGPTPTHALHQGSPAIDAGVNSLCEATDQRGEPRPVDGDGDTVATCDVGAFETPANNPYPPPQAITDVPTLNPVGMLISALFLTLSAFVLMRRRQS